MSLTSRFFSILTLAVGLTAFGTLSYAQETAPQKDGVQKRGDKEGRGFRKHRGGREGFAGMRGGHRGEFRALRGLDLTDAQKQQIRTIFERNRPDESVRTEMQAIREAKRNGTITADQKARLRDLRQQAREKSRAVHQEVLAVLTAEQRQQLEQRREEMKQRREQRKTGDKVTDKPTDN